MFSINKKRDKLFLLDLIGLIEQQITLGKKYNNTQALDLAENLGEQYIKLEEKIKTHNYQLDDEKEEQWKQRYNFKYSD